MPRFFQRLIIPRQPVRAGERIPDIGWPAVVVNPGSSAIQPSARDAPASKQARMYVKRDAALT
jgi:hypothetical protein